MSMGWIAKAQSNRGLIHPPSRGQSLVIPAKSKPRTTNSDMFASGVNQTKCLLIR